MRGDRQGTARDFGAKFQIFRAQDAPVEPSTPVQRAGMDKLRGIRPASSFNLVKLAQGEAFWRKAGERIAAWRFTKADP